MLSAGIAVLLAVVLAACTPAVPAPDGPRASTSGGPRAPGTPQVGVPPPGLAGQTTLLEVTRASGSLDVGSFQAYPGDLWIRGSCAGGDLVLHVIPLAVLPIGCDDLGDKPFANQITLRRERQMTLVVAAPRTVIWGLRVEQDQRGQPGASPSPS